MLIQEVITDLTPQEVVERATQFFTQRFTPYAGFATEQGDGHVKFVAEAAEVLIGAVPQDGRTLVRASSSRMHHEISMFLTTLAPAEEVRQNAVGPGTSGAG